MRQKLATLAVLCVCSVPLLAQTFRGGIQGTVTDASGAAIPGAEVVATSTGTGLSRTQTSGPQGEYFFPELPLGQYSVKATLSGFKPQIVKGIDVDASSTRRVNLELAPGALTETVEVTAGAALIDTTGNTQGGTIQGDQATELPVNGRDFTKLLALVPGSTADPSSINDSPGSFGLFSANGNRGRSNNYLLDGTDMNDGYRNLPAINQGGVFGTPSTILPVDAVQEFPILSGVEPEYGRNSGAVVNIVTKSGTNQFHGAVFEYFRDDSLGARNFFNTAPNPKNDFRNNQYGATLGGPIVKDKTFFFLSYEGQGERGGLPGLGRVPTQDELNSAIAANGGQANPVIAGLLARNPWPAPNRAPDAAGNNLLSTTTFTNDVDSLIAKIDHHFLSSDLLTVRYFYGNSNQSFPLALVGGGGLPGYNTVTPTNVNLVSGSLTHVFSPKLLGEFRLGYNRFHEDFLPEDSAFDPNSIGLDTTDDPANFGLPEIRVSGFAALGANRSVPRGRTDVNKQAFANLSYNDGRHRYKLGYEYRRTDVDGFFNSGYRGRLNFDSLDDFVAGRLSGGRSVIGDSSRQTYQSNHSLYLQDNFQVSRRLTLNYGVRWDYYGVIGEKNGGFSRFDPSQGPVPVNQLYDKDFNNFAPRLSAIYDLNGDGKTVLRAGWGIYYDAFSQDFFVGQLPFNTFNSGPAYNNVLFSFSTVPTLTPGGPVFTDFAATDVFTVDPHLSTPYVQNYNVNVERRLGDHAAFQIGYVGSQGRHLFRYRDINQLDPATGIAPYPNFIYVNQFESSASSSYNALQASLRMNNWHGLSSTLNYTLSKSTDNASDGQDYVPNAAQPDDSRNPSAEKGPSNFDSRHRVTWFFTWEPGAKSGKGILSGWALNGILTIASGMPVNVNYLFEDDYNGSGEFFGRPDLVGDPFQGTDGGPDRFLNLSAFQAPCNPNGEGGCAGGQHFGNLKRNAFTGPSYHNFDLSVVKNTALGERVRLQLRVDIFNVFNHPNLTNPLLPNFGVDFLQNGIDPATNRGVGYLPITATPDVGGGNPFLGGGGPRNLQLAARLSF
jgi:hypothetical protein